MNTKLITFTIILISAIASFAQGKISFANDSLHLYYWSPVIGNFLTGDEGLAGTAALDVPTPSGRSLGVYLYGGTSSGSLSLLASTTLSATLPGRQDTMNMTLPFGFPGGTPAFFQIRIQDTFLGYYHGESMVFQCTPSSNIAFNSLVNHGGTAFSTWADGTFNLDSLALGSRELTQIKCYRDWEVDGGSADTLTHNHGYPNHEHEFIRQARVSGSHPRSLSTGRSSAQVTHSL